MGLLASASDGSLCALRASHLVGRAPSADLCIPSPHVSANHAAIRWTGAGWEVRDLGSRNGTTVNRRRVEPGSPAPLTVGDVCTFGDPTEAWSLADAAPPATYAVPTRGGATLVADRGMLALPGGDQPLALLYTRPDGQWMLEVEGAAAPAVDRAMVEVGSQRWQIFLAAPVVGTADIAERLPSVRSAVLRFTVARDEEHVTLDLVEGDRAIRLAPRACHFVVLALARYRVADRERRTLPDSEQGWVYQDELCRMLRTDESRLRVDLFRFRRQLVEAGIVDGVEVVERRALSRQLRITTPYAEVRSCDP